MRLALTALLALCLAAPTRAQDGGAVDFGSFPMGDLVQNAGAFGLLGGQTNVFTGAFGATVIDDEVFIGLRIQPDLAIGKFGIGLDIPILFSPDSGSLRTDEFEDGVGFLRVIRYARYGQKRSDPFYARVGDISGTTLGFGFGLYQYSNVGSFEKRPIGLEFDVNVLNGAYGLEGLYSDFSEAGVIGARPYVRPFLAAGADIPVLKNFEIGAFYFADRSGGPATVPDPEGDCFFGGPANIPVPPCQRVIDDIGTVSMIGGDVGLPIGLGNFFQVVPYASVAQFSVDEALPFEGGTGTALGVNMRLQLIADLASVSAKLERRFFSEHFVGSYFDATYEANKLGGTLPILQLASSDGEDATVGALYGHIIDKVTLGGTLLLPNEIQRDAVTGEVINGAFLRLEALAPDLIPKINAAAVYNRRFIEDLGDAILLDERSTMQARLGYQVNRFMTAGVDYRWTFATLTDDEGEEFVKATSYVFPFAALSVDISGFGRE